MKLREGMWVWLREIPEGHEEYDPAPRQRCQLYAQDPDYPGTIGGSIHPDDREGPDDDGEREFTVELIEREARPDEL